ncbi:hypothetical protein SFRURICE_010577 [Spodoptera frugiperda]|nr:hypothetical protein SFRURICE_010577 [Spodoptera frugiperda]
MVASDVSNLHCIWARLDFKDVISFSSLVTSTLSKVTGGNLCSSFATNVGTSSGSVAFIKVMMSWTLLSVPSLLLDGIWSSFPVDWKSSILPLLISSSLKFDLQICMMLISSMVSIAFCMNANSSLGICVAYPNVLLVGVVRRIIQQQPSAELITTLIGAGFVYSAVYGGLRATLHRFHEDAEHILEQP